LLCASHHRSLTLSHSLTFGVSGVGGDQNPPSLPSRPSPPSLQSLQRAIIIVDVDPVMEAEAAVIVALDLAVIVDLVAPLGVATEVAQLAMAVAVVAVMVVAMEVDLSVDHIAPTDRMRHTARGVIQANQVRVQKVVKDPKERAKS